MPIFHRELIQGSDAWLRARTGIPTASVMDQIITPGGRPSKSAERLLCSLLAERCLGQPLVEHISMWQERGKELEQEAVAYYHLQRDCDTEPIGFVTNEAATIGASPDRLVEPDGLLEIKVPAPWQHMSMLLHDGSVYDYCKIQALGQLWITERSWIDIMSYCPGLPPALIRIQRDDKFITQLSAAVTAFAEVLESQFALCVERGWVTAKREPQPDYSQRATMDALKQSLIEVGRRSQ